MRPGFAIHAFHIFIDVFTTYLFVFLYIFGSPFGHLCRCRKIQQYTDCREDKFFHGQCIDSEAIKIIKFVLMQNLQIKYDVVWSKAMG